MFFEVVSNLISFNFQWFIPLIMNNLLWVFIFAGLGHFIFEMNLLKGTIFIAFYLYALTDFTNALGWVYQKGFFWTISLGFIAMMVFDVFFKGTKFSENRGKIASIMFYVFLFSINVFMRLKMGFVKNILNASVIAAVIFFLGFIVFGITGSTLVNQFFFSPTGLIILISLSFIELVGLRS